MTINEGGHRMNTRLVLLCAGLHRPGPLRAGLLHAALHRPALLRTCAPACMMLACLVLSVGCKRQADDASVSLPALGSAPRNPGGSGYAKLTYQPHVHVIEQAEGTNALISVSSDGSTLVFNRKLGKIPAMADGEIILIQGLLARKIIASETKGDELALLTVPAALPEIVTDAKIHVETPIRFGAAQSLTAAAGRPMLESLMNTLVPPAYAQSPVEERRKAAEAQGKKDAYGNLAGSAFHGVFDGWETTYSAEPAAGRVNLSLQLKKSVANAVALITGEGYLADFEFASDIDVEHSVPERVQMTYKKLNGNMNFKWAVQTTAAGALRGNARMKLPAAIEIPLYQYLGGLPLFLEISAAVLIKPAFGAEYEFGRGAFHVTYDGYQSFRAKDGNVDADGTVTGDIKLDESAAGAGAPVGLVLAFAAPRIELSIGVSKILKFDGFKDAAAKADQYFDTLVSKAFGADALAKFKASPMSQVTAGKIVDAALGSNAAAFIELKTTTGMSHTGTSVMVPCTRTDLHLAVGVGASASAFGQSVGNADKDIFKKDFTRVVPSEDLLCKNI
jgi:hypothetical protein